MLRRGLVSIANARSAAVKTVSLIPGDGVGPELMASVKVKDDFFFNYFFFRKFSRAPLFQFNSKKSVSLV